MVLPTRTYLITNRAVKNNMQNPLLQHTSDDVPIPITIKIQSNPNLLISNRIILSSNPILKANQSWFKSNHNLIVPITGDDMATNGSRQSIFALRIVYTNFNICAYVSFIILFIRVITMRLLVVCKLIINIMRYAVLGPHDIVQITSSQDWLLQT